MSRRIKSLETVRQVALSAERREATRLAECMRRLEDKNQKLNYLKQYLDEYTDVLRDKGNQGMTVAALRLRRDFVHQLNVALGQQSGAIDAAERLVAEQRARWVAAKRKLDAIDDLIARQKTHEARAENKKEQREHDELAGRQWTRQHRTVSWHACCPFTSAIETYWGAGGRGGGRAAAPAPAPGAARPAAAG